MAPVQIFADFPAQVVCPLCRAQLVRRDEGLRCSACPGLFPVEGGFPNLIVGERFTDELPDDELAFEECSSGATTRKFWIPLFRRTWPDSGDPPVILSLGCGVGAEVDELGDAGFAAGGIDSGNRTRLWKRRTYPNRLLLANGMHLPFRDGAFDGVFCGCVFPHVGVTGDSFEVAADCREQRLSLAREIARVLKPGGHVFVANPNRLFPFDLFHRGKGAGLVPRRNFPTDPFLLSLADLRELFSSSGLVATKALAPRHYWSFNRSQRSWKGKLLSVPVRTLFWLNSLTAAESIRSSRLAPWLVVEAQRPVA